MPQLTEADPEVAGEGSLDPLGLGVIADRLGDQLLPGITNRMRRPRMLTAMAVGVLASEGLADSSPPADGRSTPSICFEWLVLTAYVRRRSALGQRDLVGVPGPTKVAAALERGDHVTFGNYLKAPSVFGFTGVLYPLASARGLLDAARGPGERSVDLTGVWERDHDLDGFTDGDRGTPGGSFRRRVRDEVDRALQLGRCAVAPNAHLLGDLTRSLNPSGAGRSERTFLRTLITDPSVEFVNDIAQRLQPFQADRSDQELLGIVRSGAPVDLARRLDAIAAYEAVAVRLEAVFRQWQWRSTLAGLTPVDAAEVATDPTVRRAEAELVDAIRTARELIADLDINLATAFEALVAELENAVHSRELAAAIVHHHQRVQAGKAPRGKRSWFEPAGGDASERWIVRPIYRLTEAPEDSFDHFNRPYRLAALNDMLRELQ